MEDRLTEQNRRAMCELKGMGRQTHKQIAKDYRQAELQCPERARGRRFRRRGFPRLWHLLGFAFPEKVRRGIYELGLQDLLRSYVLARRYRTRWTRRWLTFAFSVRTILLILSCIRTMVTQSTLDWLVAVFQRGR